MTRKAKLILKLAGFVIALALFLTGCVVLLLRSEWPGGMRPDYPAADYDPRLTRVASTATPVIAALERYHDDHAAFPARAPDLGSYFSSPPGQPPATGSDTILDWHYTRLERTGGYVLSYKLGWDPALQYHYDGSEERWVFDPGDGSAEKIILLKP